MYTICIDFDGVLHSYTSGWQGADVISDPPVEGAIEWLTNLIKDSNLKPVIYSSRSKDPDGVIAMQDWLFLAFEKETNEEHARELLSQLEFPTQKPAAFLTIDDRCIRFEGEFPGIQEIKDFKPWNRR